ncbi:MAG TPA: hypothetical protein EYP10_02895 [Armatimonadetes bacterium]|nr:hypothetical protein [Armatimonadota bacterium]
MVVRGVIPAAGYGTRLYPVTKTQPKEMLPVGRKPVIQYVVEELARAGISDILIVTGRYKNTMEAYFDDHFPATTVVEPALRNWIDLNVRIYYVRQPHPRGTGHAVGLARGFTNAEPFVVAMGDSIIWGTQNKGIIEELIDAHISTGSVATIAVEAVEPTELPHYGVVRVEGNERVRRVLGIVEKPSPYQAPSNLAVAGRYVFDPIIYDALTHVHAEDGKELGLTAGIRVLIEQGYPVYCVQLSDEQQRMDVGNFPAYFRAFIRACLEDPELRREMASYMMRMLEHYGVELELPRA